MQRRLVNTLRAKRYPQKYEHKINLHTDGFLKTVIHNSRDIYKDLRNNFKANPGFNIILFIVIGSYALTIVGRLYLDYRKVKHEENVWEHNHNKKNPLESIPDQEPIHCPPPAKASLSPSSSETSK
ncbi:unnamed protein product [Adineta ricciae]|uniref:Uncharacterized protein n=1 Tax=Adineta ricciae TaxID=249248 RepID=A0A815QZG5_ADIRI|nr:unnamed protein product [Adineta ricciae]CAF1536960.1 unnamed protein product [Adineta ricciae]